MAETTMKALEPRNQVLPPCQLVRRGGSDYPCVLNGRMVSSWTRCFMGWHYTFLWRTAVGSTQVSLKRSVAFTARSVGGLMQ